MAIADVYWNSKVKSSSENFWIFFRRKTFHYKSRLQQQECQALFPTKIRGCWSGLKTQPEGQALSKMSVLGVIGSGKQKCPPSFVSANKVINKDKHMEVLIQHVMAWIRHVYVTGNVWNQTFYRMPRQSIECPAGQAFYRIPRQSIECQGGQGFCRFPRHSINCLGIL